MNQTVQDFEIIVVDGGSTDDGPQIVQNNVDQRITFFIQAGKGVSTARNQGVEVSNSNLIAFLDADDEWMPHHLEKILRLRQQYPECGAYSTAYKIHMDDGVLRLAKYKGIPPAPWEGIIPNYFKSGTLGEYPVWTSVVCIPIEILTEMGGFPEDEWYGEDADLFGKIALKYPIAFSWYVGGIYHWESINRICNKKLPLNEEPFVKTAKEMIQSNIIPSIFLKDLKNYVVKKELLRAESHLENGNFASSIQILKKTKTRNIRLSYCKLLLILRIVRAYLHK